MLKQKKTSDARYKNLYILIPFLRKTKHLLILGIIGMIVSSLISAPIPYIYGYIIDNVILIGKSYTSLLQILLFVVIIYTVNFAITIFYQYLFSKAQQNIVNEMKLTMISKVIDSPFSLIDKKDRGYLLGRIAEASNVGMLFTPNILGTIAGVIDFVFSLFIMFNLSKKLSVIALLVLPIYFILSKYSSKRISNSTTNVYESSANLDGEIYETLNGLEHVKLLNGKFIQLKKFRIKLKDILTTSLRQSLNFILFVQNVILANNIVTVFVLLISGILILQGQLKIGLYTSFSLYMNRFLSTTQSLGSIDITIKPVCISLGRIKEFLNLKSENLNSAQKLNKPIVSIEFNDVSFRYSENKEPVLNHINTKIYKGDKVLLSGMNGSGKTTFLKLISGLYSPISGKILFNNIDCGTIDKSSLREKIGVVSQHVFLFKGTVLENILYGQKNKTRQDVTNLIQKYNLKNALNGLEKGLDTEIIQDGSSISGGQAQIIALMRVLLKKRDIIILDEATANLHTAIKDIVYSILQKRDIYNILIMISHQDEGLTFVNKVITLSNEQHEESRVQN